MSRRGFTILEVTVIILAVVLVVGFVLINSGGRHGGHGNRLYSSNNVRGILQGLAVYAEAHENRLPGQAGNEEDSDPSVLGRLAPLVRDNIVVFEMLKNPVDPTAQPTEPPQVALTNLAFKTSYTLQSAAEPTWSNDTSAAMVLVADENLGRGRVKANTASHWNTRQWQGATGWGDTHVNFEPGPVVTTAFQPTPRHEIQWFAEDALFDTRGHAQLLTGDQ